jgi:polysaccharide export outer membrane protein
VVPVGWKSFLALGLLLILQGSVQILAQTSSGSQVDCSDPIWSGSSSCRQQQQQLNPDTLPDSSTTPTGTSGLPNATQIQREPERSSQIYVDDAGNTQKEQVREPQKLNSLFPPDPVTDLQRLAKISTGEALTVFGRDLFQKAPSTFAPADQITPLPDYVLGPGDQILLRLWGHQSLNSQLTIDSSGSIYVPQVGAIHVAGLRFEQLQDRVNEELSHTFRNYNLSLNLGHLRSVQVYVVGEARRPGAYTVSSLSTVLNALLASGGPNVQGSLRDIQIRREGQPAMHFDVYDFVLRGDKSKDIRLQSGDTIFIPVVGPQVALAGSVRHPAIYELHGDTSFADLVSLAGGYSATASKTQVSLERIEDGQVRRTLSVGLDSTGLAMNLRDGDVLYINHITRGFEKSVTIRGNLANAGRFPWHTGMKLSDIIPDRRSLLTNGYWRERNALGVPTPLFEPRELYTPPIYQPRTSANTRDGRTARDSYQQNQNQNQDQYQYPYQNQQQDSAVTDSGSIPPTDQQIGATGVFGQLLGVNQQDASLAAPSQDPYTRQQDSTTTQNRTGRPSDSTWTRGSLAEQQESASNPSVANRAPRNKIQIPAAEIDWSYAVIERLDPNTLKSSLVPFNLGKLVQDHDPAQDLELQAGDVVTILSQSDVHVPIDEQTKYVRLEGEFAAAGTYSVGPNDTLQDLVARAGGLTPKAYLFGASFTRESARVIQQQRLDEYVSTLSIDMERSAAVRTASSTTGITDPNTLVQERSLIAQLKELRATGRVVLEFHPNSVGLESIPKLPLEDGDIFRIPSRPLIVSVIGAVYGQNIFIYDSNRRVADYVQLAGKPNRIADWKHSFIIRADGSVYSRERARGVWTNNFNNVRINPGDTIVIPEKLIKPSLIRQVIDYSQIFSQFALGAAAINVVR